jgi:hypothetical protein
MKFKNTHHTIFRMKSVKYKLTEFFIIFIVLPISFALHYPWQLKLVIGVLGFLYVIYILLNIEKNRFKIAPKLKWKLFWKETLLKLILIAIINKLFVWLKDW